MGGWVGWGSGLVRPPPSLPPPTHSWLPTLSQSLHLNVLLSSYLLRFIVQTELTLEDLKTKFRQHSITATLQCTGNRRDEFNKSGRPVKGLEWEGGSISTAGRFFTPGRVRQSVKGSECGRGSG